MYGVFTNIDPENDPKAQEYTILVDSYTVDSTDSLGKKAWYFEYSIFIYLPECWYDLSLIVRIHTDPLKLSWPSLSRRWSPALPLPPSHLAWSVQNISGKWHGWYKIGCSYMESLYLTEPNSRIRIYRPKDTQGQKQTMTVPKCKSCLLSSSVSAGCHTG